MCKRLYEWSTGAGQPVEGFVRILDCGSRIVVITWHRNETGREQAVEIIIEGRLSEVRAV